MYTGYMMISVIALGFCQLLALVGAFFVAKRWIRGQRDQIVTGINEELTKLITNEPCQTASVLNAAGQLIGREAGKAVVMAIKSSLGSAGNIASGIAYDQTVEAIGQAQPALGGILGNLGKQKGSKLLNNPLVQLAVQGFLGGGFGAGQPDNGSSSANEYKGRKH
jgi:hypothetical protein